MIKLDQIGNFIANVFSGTFLLAIVWGKKKEKGKIKYADVKTHKGG